MSTNASKWAPIRSLQINLAITFTSADDQGNPKPWVRLDNYSPAWNDWYFTGQFLIFWFCLRMVPNTRRYRRNEDGSFGQED